MVFGRKRTTMVDREDALSGRDRSMPVADRHVVLGTPLQGPWPDGHEVIYFGMGCFWGAERIFWQIPGVYATAAGYQGGFTPNPTYEEVCTGRTGHTEAVLVVYDPGQVDLDVLLKAFWENHDPTQGMRQGNDVGTQYRSAIYVTTPEQRATAEASRAAYQRALTDAGYGEITTEIRDVADAGPFYYAEDYHQGYLDKNPYGYCNHGFCQVAYADEPAGA
jgi:peptide-methionine (S)-S-oxide reductase